MNEITTVQDLAESLCAKGTITAEDVMALRRGVFPDGVVDAHEAEAVFRLDQACSQKDPVWTRFYVDALTDYFVWQSKPKGYVDEKLAQVLIDKIVHDGRIDAMSELELLINVVHWAIWCPEQLSVLVLEAMRQSVLSPATASYGSNRPPCVITPADVEIIRKAVYAPGSPGGFTVTRREAELMFELNDATSDSENAPTWPDLFVKAVANHLMFPRGAPVVPDANEALRREAWLNDRRGVGALLMNVGRSLGTGDVPVGEAWKEADLFGTRGAEEERAVEEARVREALSRESIDAEEAQWLLARLHADGDLHDSERKLLAFIKQNAPSFHPDLKQVMATAGI